ncbi:hypothetical protein AALA99_00830 [Anaerotruncus colihominis]|uniref:hypothetical protein n=1 Tax=Anaerotruncus colihominis TaxID=169435 RepID=UPI001364078F|nr:hypothetical protein [Anaerotruncus colihominis]
MPKDNKIQLNKLFSAEKRQSHLSTAFLAVDRQAGAFSRISFTISMERGSNNEKTSAANHLPLWKGGCGRAFVPLVSTVSPPRDGTLYDGDFKRICRKVKASRNLLEQASRVDREQANDHPVPIPAVGRVG